MSDTQSDYANTRLDVVPSKLDIVNLTVASNAARQSTSTPCKKAWIQAAISNASHIMMNVDAAATSVVGIALPHGGGLHTISAVISTAAVPSPMEVEIDNLNKLYFWSATDGDIVNILYRK